MSWPGFGTDVGPEWDPTQSVVLVSDEPVQAKAVDDLSVERAPRALLQVVHDLAALGEAGDQWRRVTGVAVPSNESIEPTSAATPANASTPKAMPADILATRSAPRSAPRRSRVRTFRLRTGRWTAAYESQSSSRVGLSLRPHETARIAPILSEPAHCNLATDRPPRMVVRAHHCHC